MSLQRARMFAQHIAVHLARARERKLVKTMDPFRPFVASQPALGEKSVELFVREVTDDERDRYFAELGVRAPDDADIRHTCMCPHHPPALLRLHFLSAPN